MSFFSFSLSKMIMMIILIIHNANAHSYHSGLFSRGGVWCEPDKHNMEPPHVLQLLPPLCEVTFACCTCLLVCFLNLFVCLYFSHVSNTIITTVGNATLFHSLLMGHSTFITNKHKWYFVISNCTLYWNSIQIFSPQVFPAGLLQWKWQ